MLGKAQIELQKIIDTYVSASSHAVSTPYIF